MPSRAGCRPPPAAPPPTARPGRRPPRARRRSTAFLDAGLADGGFRPVVAEVFDGLDSIRDAHRLTESDRRTGRIVVRLWRRSPDCRRPE
ncbi:zinc-binding dehydrogenase [Streptomyces sp. TRM68416]|nr:zinc-binding dehydrogenase [Streptomyces sp. TRM68416]MBD0844654.1 zinc-binding dehydrogenase [Streptomyces sp. TRM68416]